MDSAKPTLRGRIAARREKLENSESLKRFRCMRLLSELRRAHRKMEEPKTLEEYLASKAREKLDKAKNVFAGVNLPA